MIKSSQDFNSTVFFTLGVEIASQIKIGDLVLQGDHCKCGHMIVNCADDARLCNCGQRGHLDAYASTTAVVDRTREALQSGRSSSLSQRLAAGETLTPKLLADEAEKGDELSLEIVMDTGRYLALGIVNLMHTVDPNAVLLGGEMTFGGGASELGRRFLDTVRQEVRRLAFEVLSERITIEFAPLDGHAQAANRPN
jgi:glucokinase